TFMAPHGARVLLPRCTSMDTVESAANRSSSGSFLPPALRHGVGTRLQPEQRLMLAILEAAVDDFQKYARASTGRGRRLFADAERWFASAAVDEPLTFESICDALDLDPACIRGGLRRWRRVRRQQLLRVSVHRVNGIRPGASAASSLAPATV